MVYLFFPRGCAGCARPDCILCDPCLRKFHTFYWQPISSTIYQLGKIWCLSGYENSVRQAILQWKDHGDCEVGAYFHYFLKKLSFYVSKVYVCSRERSNNLENKNSSLLLIIPAPSSQKSIARRGRVHVLELAEVIAKAFQKRVPQTVIAPCLTMPRHVKKSVTLLSKNERRQRAIKEKIHVNRALLNKVVASHENSPSHIDAVVVDDICTTGSTLIACATALKREGINTMMAIVLACGKDNITAV